MTQLFSPYKTISWSQWRTIQISKVSRAWFFFFFFLSRSTSVLLTDHPSLDLLSIFCGGGGRDNFSEACLLVRGQACRVRWRVSYWSLQTFTHHISPASTPPTVKVLSQHLPLGLNSSAPVHLPHTHTLHPAFWTPKQPRKSRFIDFLKMSRCTVQYFSKVICHFRHT